MQLDLLEALASWPTAISRLHFSSSFFSSDALNVWSKDLKEPRNRLGGEVTLCQPTDKKYDCVYYGFATRPAR